MIKVYFEKLGCGKNIIDAELMESVLIEKKFQIVENPEDSDVIVVNTCGFIDAAKKEAIDYILTYVELKNNNKDLKIIVSGCLAQRYPGDLFKDIPEIDAIIGVYSYDIIYNVIERLFKGEKRIIQVKEKPEIIFDSSIKRVDENRYSAEVKIADGCNNYCSYCVIPYLRGDYKSKRFEKIIEEVKDLANQGVKEIILCAQETTRYGVDLYSKYRLTELLEKLSQIESVRWIRLLYCNLWDIDDELLKLMNENEKILKYFDVPLQNVNKDILKAMNRRGSMKEIEEKIEYIRNKVPGVALRSTLITGFPGETEEQFLQNVDFLKRVKLDKVGVFQYSKEDITKASKMSDMIDDDEKERRQEALMITQQEVSLEINEEFVGQELEIIVEGIQEDYYFGRSYRDAPEIDGLVFFESSEDIEIGNFVKVKITQADVYDLIGELI